MSVFALSSLSLFSFLSLTDEHMADQDIIHGATHTGGHA